MHIPLLGIGRIQLPLCRIVLETFYSIMSKKLNFYEMPSKRGWA
jgi:hypothetical protein